MLFVVHDLTLWYTWKMSSMLRIKNILKKCEANSDWLIIYIYGIGLSISNITLVMDHVCKLVVYGYRNGGFYMTSLYNFKKRIYYVVNELSCLDAMQSIRRFHMCLICKVKKWKSLSPMQPRLLLLTSGAKSRFQKGGRPVQDCLNVYIF